MIAVLIILICVFIVILFAVNLYLLALYCHPDDKGWGNVIYTKILVVLGLTLCQAQALMVPLDVANESALLSDGKIDMVAFWTFLYIIILLMVVVFLPYAMFLYETD
jgi:LMBR1 domain-containing protein 1